MCVTTRRQKNQSGQSTIEFALTLTFMMGFVLFFLQFCFLIAYGNLVHYATFMAGRAYLSAGPSEEDQAQRAREVIIRILKKSPGDSRTEKYGFIARGVDGDSMVPGMMVGPGDQFKPDHVDSSWMQGVRYKFRSKLTLVPIGSAKPKEESAEDVNSVTLTSESWLGREKTESECNSAMPDGGVLDNGC